MIIHNPEITGSLLFPRTDGTKVVIQLSSQGGLETVVQDSNGTVTGIPASNFSGSFTGSFVGDGSQITGVAASSLNIDLFTAGTISGDDEILFSDTDDDGTEKRGTFVSGLNSLGVISSSIQVDVEQTTNFTAFSSSIASTFAGLSSNYEDLIGIPSGIISGSTQVQFNDITNNPFEQVGPDVIVDKNLVPSGSNITLGTAAAPFKDLYLSSASLYIDGQQVLSSNATELILTTDVNQSLKLLETGADTIQIQTANGDITLTSTGTGNIELDAPVQIVAGNKVLSSDGNAIVFGEDLDIEGNLTLSGTVDGVDIAALNTDFGTLKGKTLVSSSAQISAYGIFAELDGDNLVSGSSQISFNGIVDKPTLVSQSAQVVLESANKTGFTGASSITTLGTISTGVWQGSIIASQYLDADPLPVGSVSGSSQIVLQDADKTGFTGASSITTLGTVTSGNVTAILPSGTISGSSQVTITESQISDLQSYVTTTSAQALGSGTALSLATNTLTLTKGDGTTDTIDLSAYLDEDARAIASGTLDGATGIVTFTRDDSTTFTLDLSALLDDTNLVTSVNGAAGVVVLDTDDISEPVSPTNKYFTDARARAAISAGGDLSYNSGTGVMSYTGRTDAQVRGLISVTDNGGDGALSYNSSTGVISYTGPSAADVRAHFSAGTGVSIASGVISIGQAVATNSTVQFAKVGVGGASDATYELKVTGDIGATGDIVAYISSDERLKDNIELISNPIEKVQSLKGVTWEWNGNASEAARQSPNVGVIAQDVEKVLPQLVHDRDNGYKGVDYAKLTGLLIEAIKEQQKQIDELKSKLG